MLQPPSISLEVQFSVDPRLRLIDFALATRMSAGALDIRGLFHRFALDAAVFTFRRRTRTVGVCALLDSFGTHRFLLFTLTTNIRCTL